MSSQIGMPWGQRPATDRQWDYLLEAKDRRGDQWFYDQVEKVSGKRTTTGLTKEQASRILDKYFGKGKARKGRS